MRLTPRVSRLFFVLCLCFVVSEACLVVASHGARSSQWWALAALGAVGLTCTVWLAFAGEQSTPGVRFVLCFAAVTRLMPLLAQPILDDDYFRFLWDGYQLTHGVSPYSSAPALNVSRTDIAEQWHDVLAQINHPDVPTIYGPFLQAIFAFAVVLGGAHPIGLQAIFCGIDLALVGALLRVRIAPCWVMMYVVNPLVIKEICYSLHPDGMLAAALTFSALALANRRALASGFWMAAVGCAKLPLALLMLALNVRNALHRRALLYAALISMALYLPFIWGGNDPFLGLKTFAEDWRVNALGFSVLEWVSGGRARTMLALFYVVTGVATAFLVTRYRIDTARALVMWLAVIVTFSPAVNPWYWLPLLPLSLVAQHARGAALLTPWVGSFALLLAYVNGELLSAFNVSSTLGQFQVHPLARLVEAVLLVSALCCDFKRLWQQRCLHLPKR